MSFAWTFPAGKLRIVTRSLTAATPDNSLRPTLGRKWVVLAVGVLAAALDANRVYNLHLSPNGTTFYRLAVAITVASTATEQFNLSNLQGLVIDYDSYFWCDSTMTGTDAAATLWALVLEV